MPSPAADKRAALTAAADKMLIADARRRRGKRYGARVQGMIVAGRYQ